MKEKEKTHIIQRLMDNTWLLLVLGVLIPLLSYTAWGWIELLFIQPATLP
jgi:hypothetical protein